MVRTTKRRRTPAPEFDPAREWLKPYLEEPTSWAVHEVLGTFVLRERSWRVAHFFFLGGAALATLLGIAYILFPDDFRVNGFQLAKALVAASPFLVFAFWLRLRRRRLRKMREAHADAVAEALIAIIARLEHPPAIDTRMRQEALRFTRQYPRLRSVIEGIGQQTAMPLGGWFRKRGWLRGHRDC